MQAIESRMNIAETPTNIVAILKGVEMMSVKLKARPPAAEGVGGGVGVIQRIASSDAVLVETEIASALTVVDTSEPLGLEDDEDVDDGEADG